MEKGGSECSYFSLRSIAIKLRGGSEILVGSIRRRIISASRISDGLLLLRNLTLKASSAVIDVSLSFYCVLFEVFVEG